ncbi:hypothetical protein [Paenibacillus cremeus]|uniref:Uncharacterized protein n=1 Tax=Paenibacillus cremeus TaxID=2163881 RepID=A0A559KCN3_9BACL|nr:hypothetical protein [Paenibacillus cremeus]TVY09892.1 hypothetical protein FPZ49_11005 [Paenibacillus cremeus]
MPHAARLDKQNFDYDFYLENWDRGRQFFMIWLEFVCGLSKESGLYKIIDSSVCSDSDLIFWIDHYDGDFNPEGLEATTRRYIQSKLGDNS